MLIKLNGKTEEVKTRSSLIELILSKGLKAEEIVIEQNLRIVPREQWQNTYLFENDRIEIVSFFGGG